MDIKILKLVTGEEIIGEVVEKSQTGITLKNTLAIMVQPTREGISYGFIPWGQLVVGDKNIAHEYVVFSGEPTEEIHANYAEQFGSIVVSSKQLIT
ncbi:hypothetical protein UFOVP49_148 [uncultured Caudovirales phage]|uniref:Uncharacterized protein n=1 Tax=uncultured Caudovirales phage TaxID=2100421 RepID=A0A6J5KVR4_9CAUD|nr:hypothetical protein UFOVP49_148 [uncultured Caudovirales phage]